MPEISRSFLVRRRCQPSSHPNTYGGRPPPIQQELYHTTIAACATAPTPAPHIVQYLDFKFQSTFKWCENWNEPPSRTRFIFPQKLINNACDSSLPANGDGQYAETVVGWLFGIYSSTSTIYIHIYTYMDIFGPLHLYYIDDKIGIGSVRIVIAATANEYCLKTV